MAFLRFTRDTRGYEHFHLVQQTTNRRGKVRPRLLYWFRTPPNVKVGRQPFDEAVRRALEAQNPDIHFDWQAIIDTPIPPPVETERWREKRRFERAARQAAAEETREAAGESIAVAEPQEEAIDSSAASSQLLDEPGPDSRPQETSDVHEVRLPPSPLRGFGEPGPPSGPQDTTDDHEVRLKPDATDLPSGPLDSGRRKRRRRRGRRSRPPVVVSPGQTAPLDSGVQPPIEDIEPSDPEGE